jgi:hypothetical protein
MLHQLFVFPFNVNHASSKKNTSTVSRNPLSTNSWNYCNNCLLLFSICDKAVLQIRSYISTVLKALLFCELSILMPHCQQSIGAKISYGLFYLSTITSQFSVTWNLKITYFLPVQQKACHSKFFHYSTHHSFIQHIFFFENFGDITKITHVNKTHMAKYAGGESTLQHKATMFQEYWFSAVQFLSYGIPQTSHTNARSVHLELKHRTLHIWIMIILLSVKSQASYK